MKKIFLTFLLFFSVAMLHSADTVSYYRRMADEYIARNTYTSLNWEYVSGLEMRGLQELYLLTKTQKYFDIIKRTVDYVVPSTGIIKSYKILDYNLDQIAEGKQVLYLYSTSNEAKYKRAADTLRKQLQFQPRTSDSGFWHKKVYPYQMWLDGLYMSAPYYAQYCQMFNEYEGFNDIAKQITLIESHTRDSKTGLLYHGWDESKQQIWANKTTGCSANFWGRAMGWYAMAIVDALDYFPKEHPKRNDIIAVMQRLADAVSKVQDDSTGLWFQVLDKGWQTGNYVEGTVSCMLTYSLGKAARLGYIDAKYRDVAIKGFIGINKHLVKIKSNSVSIEPVCYGAGLSADRDGSYDYYVYKATKGADNKDMIFGSFLLAGVEIDPLATSTQENNFQVNASKNSLTPDFSFSQFQKGKLKIQVNTTGTYKIYIFDLSGKCIEQSLCNTRFYTSYNTNRSGVYIVRIIANNWVYNKKVYIY